MTTIVNTKIGQSRDVPRIWIEGYKLIRAGLKIGSKYGLIKGDADSERLELREVDADFTGPSFNVSKRERNGITTPLIEIRTNLLKAIFNNIERVKVVIKLGRIVVTACFIETRIRERVTRLMTKLRNKEKLAVCSLFHGGGLLDLALHSGLKRVGLSSFVQVGVEMESDYLDSSLRNNSHIWTENSIAICSDIRDVDFSRNTPQADICLAGVPCTSSSKAGRAKNKNKIIEEHETAGTLFMDFLEAIKATNPAIVELENVVEYANSSGMAVIRSVLSSLGYILYEGVLNGNDFGALENRRRMVVIAITKGLDIEFDFTKLQPVREKEAKISDVLEDISPTSELWKPFEYLAKKAVRDKADGKNFARQLLTGSESYCGTIGKGYSKCRSTEPFILHPTNPDLSRLLTPLEHARVKGAPIEAIHGLSNATANEVLGQSVIFPKFESINMYLGDLLCSLIGTSALGYVHQEIVVPKSERLKLVILDLLETNKELPVNEGVQAMLF